MKPREIDVRGRLCGGGRQGEGSSLHVWHRRVCSVMVLVSLRGERRQMAQLLVQPRQISRTRSRHGHGLGEDGGQRGVCPAIRDSGELHVAGRRRRRRRAVALGSPVRRDGPRRSVTRRRRNRGRHVQRAIQRRGRRQGVLPPAAAVGELMEVQPTGELRLLEMVGDVFVGHLLVASLDEEVLLHVACQLLLFAWPPSASKTPTYLGLAPRTSSASQDRLPTLGYTLFVPLDNVVLGDVTRLRHYVCWCVVCLWYLSYYVHTVY